MKIPLVDLKAQYESIKPEIQQAINRCLDNTSFIGGREVEEFGKEFAEFCGSEFCVPVANGTDALEIALKALGVGPGDEVIIPDMTFIATAEAVITAGATPVFCDVDPDYYTLAADQIEGLITEKTRAIIPVYLYGQMAEMDRIQRIASDHDLYIIEDAAQAHGATFRGQLPGQFGQLTTFSFYPGKNLGAYGDAGAIISNDEELAKRCKMIANHGRISKYNHEFSGRNSRMDALQAAVLKVKLKYLCEWTEKRNQAAELYTELLDGLPLAVPKVRDGAYSAFHLYVIRVEQKLRDPLISHLKDSGIGAGIHYPIALHNLNAFNAQYQPQDFPVSNALQDEVISLPVFPEITREQIEKVVVEIGSFL